MKNKNKICVHINFTQSSLSFSLFDKVIMANNYYKANEKTIIDTGYIGTEWFERS